MARTRGGLSDRGLTAEERARIVGPRMGLVRALDPLCSNAEMRAMRIIVTLGTVIAALAYLLTSIEMRLSDSSRGRRGKARSRQRGSFFGSTARERFRFALVSDTHFWPMLYVLPSAPPLPKNLCTLAASAAPMNSYAK